MATKRRVGTTRATSEGTDPLAGVHRGSAAGRRLPRADRADALSPNETGVRDTPDLDDRERRQKPRRKAPGPSATRSPGTDPARPNPGSPPATDPA